MSVPVIRIQRLFLFVLVLKLLAAGLGWYLQSPWLLGFAVPLGLMAAYIVMGCLRRDTEVSDDKFADTCYYLGFIFTITSIVFCLLDLPNIGTRIQDIAVRFGAAMVSTVAGLAVRVYLVSFRKDAGDAMRDVESALIDASNRFAEHLTMSMERLRNFELQVHTAVSTSVELVNVQLETLSRNQSEKLVEFFEALTSQNQQTLSAALDEVKVSSVRLASSVDSFASEMKLSVGSIESRVLEFASVVSERMRETTFPDDFFSRHLANPMQQLEQASQGISTNVVEATAAISEATTGLNEMLRKAKRRAASAEGALASVVALTEQQKLGVEASQAQLAALHSLSERLTSFDGLLSETLAEVRANQDGTARLLHQLGDVISDSSDSRRSFEQAVSSVSARLEKSAEASERSADALKIVATGERDAGRALRVVSERAESAVGKAADVVVRLGSLVDNIARLSVEIRALPVIRPTPDDTSEAARTLTTINDLTPRNGISYQPANGS